MQARSLRMHMQSDLKLCRLKRARASLYVLALTCEAVFLALAAFSRSSHAGVFFLKVSPHVQHARCAVFCRRVRWWRTLPALFCQDVSALMRSPGLLCSLCFDLWLSLRLMTSSEKGFSKPSWRFQTVVLCWEGQDAEDSDCILHQVSGGPQRGSFARNPGRGLDSILGTGIFNWANNRNVSKTEDSLFICPTWKPLSFPPPGATCVLQRKHWLTGQTELDAG